MKLLGLPFLHTLAIILLINTLKVDAQEVEEVKEDDALEQLIDSIFIEFNDLNKPGAAVAVVKNGEIVFKKGYGSANLEYDIPNTPSTIFHIASVSKQFTVFSILLLANQGKLNLEDDVRKYIPEVPDFGKTITLRHLASHTSGLRDQWRLLAMAGWRLDDVITKDHVLKLVANQKELNFEPGEEYLYSNTGFTLLAEVVSRVSGQSFAEFTKSEIFEPLKMSNTLFYDDHEKIVKNRAYSYYSDSTGYKKSVLSFAIVGATSLFTTVEDLSLWALNFSSPKVGNADIINQMNTLATLNNGKTFGGAYGQFVNQYKGLNQIQHGGSDAGYRSYFGRFPEQKFAVIVFSNYAASNAGRLALQVTDLYLDEYFDKPSIDNQIGERNFIKLSNGQLESFCGNYWSEKAMYSRKIYLKNDTLRYFRGGANESPLAAIGNNEFQMLNVEADLKVEFQNNEDKRTMVVRNINGNSDKFDAFNSISYSSNQLNEYTGTFYSEELSTSYTFRKSEDHLIAEHSRLSSIIIEPTIKQDMFSGNQWFFRNIKFERDDTNNIIGMRVSNNRVRNLKKKKTERNKSNCCK